MDATTVPVPVTGPTVAEAVAGFVMVHGQSVIVRVVAEVTV